MLNTVQGSQSASVFRIGQAIDGYEKIKDDLENLPEVLGTLSNRWKCYRAEFKKKEVDPAQTNVAGLLDSEAKEFQRVLATIEKIQATYLQLQTAIESCGVSAKKTTDYTSVGEDEIKGKLPIISGKLENICKKITTLTTEIDRILPIARENLERTFFHANNLEDPNPRTATTVLIEKLSSLVWTSPPPRYSLEKTLEELAKQPTVEEKQTTGIETEDKPNLSQTIETMTYKQESEILQQYNRRLDDLSKLKPSIKFPLRPITEQEISIGQEVVQVKEASPRKEEPAAQPIAKEEKAAQLQPKPTNQAESVKGVFKPTQAPGAVGSAKKSEKKPGS